MDSELLRALLLFFASAAVVIVSGIFLAKYGDILADLMGWGRLWVGTILVAVATSLPELVTNLTAVSRDLPELAGGNILGANMVNMFTLAAVGLAFGGPFFFRRISPEQKYLVVVALILTSLAVLFAAVTPGVSVAKVGLGSFLIPVVYLAGMRLVYVKRPTTQAVDAVIGSDTGQPGLRTAWLYFGAASVAVIGAAIVLAWSAEQISEVTGLSGGFVGVVAVALVTTMPEATTTIAAVRFNAVDLAIGGLYGSCAFNVLVLAIVDPFYRGGVLLDELGPAHLAAGIAALLLMTAGLIQILLRGRLRFLPPRPWLVLMCAGYLVGLLAVYQLE